MALHGALSGLLAFVWLVALWCAAPVCLGVRSQRESLPDRLLGMVAIGSLAPYLLALVGILSWASCYAVVLALCFVRARSVGWPHVAWNGPAPLVWPLVAVAFAAGVSLVRPPLEGDTLGYHLMSALTWANSHSLWQTGTRYWWYPGGSELFASGIIATGGSWAVGLAGTLVAALLCSRLVEWGRALGASPLASGLIASALIVTPVAASQAADLQNDLWVAALFVECLWGLRVLKASGALPQAVLTIVKPSGFIYSAIAAIVGRQRWTTSALAWIPLLVWALRDLLLWRGAIIAPSSTGVPDVVSTTVAAHGIHGLQILAAALWGQGIPTACLFLIPFFGLWVSEVRREAWTAIVCHVLFVFEPFGFAGSVPQLVNGASLRFDLPALALGAVIAMAIARRKERLSIVFAACCVAIGTITLASAYWNDALTRLVLPLVGLIVLVCIVTPVRWRHRVAIGGAVVAIGAAAMLAAGRATSFYNALVTSYDRQPTTAFSWIAGHELPAIVTLDLRGGSVGMVSPHTRVYDGKDDGFCDEARRLDAALIVGTDLDRPKSLHQEREDAARACGDVLFADKAVIVVRPFPTRRSAR